MFFEHLESDPPDWLSASGSKTVEVHLASKIEPRPSTSRVLHSMRNGNKAMTRTLKNREPQIDMQSSSFMRKCMTHHVLIFSSCKPVLNSVFKTGFRCTHHRTHPIDMNSALTRPPLVFMKQSFSGNHAKSSALSMIREFYFGVLCTSPSASSSGTVRLSVSALREESGCPRLQEASAQSVPRRASWSQRREASSRS